MPLFKTDRSVPTRHQFEDDMSIRDLVNFATRPGRRRESLRRGDVNLPAEKPKPIAKPRSLSKR